MANRPTESPWLRAQLSALPDPGWSGRPEAEGWATQRPPALAGLRRALRALGVAALVAGVVVGALVLRSDHVPAPQTSAALVLLLGWSFVAVGLVAWGRQPEQRTGALCVLVGFSALGAGLSASDLSLSFTVGLAVSGAWPAALTHLLLALPEGSLRPGWPRRIVFAAWSLALVQGAAVLLSPVAQGCEGCPPVLALTDVGSGVAGAVYAGYALALGAVAIYSVTVLLRRFGRTAGGRRRAVDVALLPGAAALLATAAARLAVGGAGTAGGWGLAGWPSRLLALAVPVAFVVGVLRERLRGATAVAELVERLGEASRPGRVTVALAGALGDPSLTLAYWIPETERYVDADGRPVALPSGDGERAATKVERDGHPVAAIVHDAELCDQPELVRRAGAAVALALDIERLEASLRARVEELRDSRARMVRAQDTERRRLERNLHDGAQQRLVAVSLRLRLAMGKLPSDPGAAGGLLEETFDELQRAIDELRELARGIHPAVLSDRGLEPALAALADRFPLRVALETELGERMEPPVEAAAYYVVAEALTNVAKYAQASHADVRVAREGGLVVVEVSDDGVGGADPAAGSGLRGLWDRVGALEGRIDVMSPAGQGTTIRAKLPARPEAGFRT